MEARKRAGKTDCELSIAGRDRTSDLLGEGHPFFVRELLERFRHIHNRSGEISKVLFQRPYLSIRVSHENLPSIVPPAWTATP